MPQGQGVQPQSLPTTYLACESVLLCATAQTFTLKSN